MNRTLFFLIVLFVSTAVISAAQDNSSQPPTPQAEVQLGNLYIDQKDYSKAMTWFRKAAEQGSVVAQNNIGWLYQNGFGVQQDYAETMKWYREAAEQGYALAQNNIGWLYDRGFGVKQDYAEAMSWYRKAAEQGDATAQDNIGVFYDKGRGVKQDYAEAMSWYRKAAAQNNADAQNNIGMLYENGLGVEQNYVSAMAWFSMAADQGNVLAQGNIGWLYENGLGVAQDYAKAMTWYRKAADQGEAQSQNNMGLLYQRGLGVSQDFAQAMAWYLKAADQGNAMAQNNIGWLYQNGWGVKQDYTEAMTWYRKAADQGYAKAKTNITGLSPAIEHNSQKAGTVENRGTSPSDKTTPPAIIMGNGIRAPHAVYDPEPEYSEDAHKKGITGTVLLSVVIGTDGHPRDIKVVLPLGDGLDAKAVDAIKTWKFDPATKDGKPVAVQVMVQVDFHLDPCTNIIGKVETVDGSASPDLDSYLSPLILETQKCWNAAIEDKTHAPSLKQGQVRTQFGVTKNGQMGATEITSSSGDAVLDQAAHNCISSLKIEKLLPAELSGKDIVVRMQLLYNMGVLLNPSFATISAGGKEQFYIAIAGDLSKKADWSLFGAGCKDTACGTISSDGLYTAPDVLPDPAYVRVKGTLPGANLASGSAIVMLVK